MSPSWITLARRAITQATHENFSQETFASKASSSSSSNGSITQATHENFGQNNGDASDSTSSRPITQATHENFHRGLQGWEIALIVLACVFFVAAVGFGTVWWLQRRKYMRANQHDMGVEGGADNADDFDPRARAEMSEAELWEAEERERSMMIRKSLASRTAYSRPGQQNDVENPFVDPADQQQSYPYSSGAAGGGGQLREEFKEWEADQHRSRTNSASRDPAAQGHPALSPTPPSSMSPRSNSPPSVHPHDRY